MTTRVTARIIVQDQHGKRYEAVRHEQVNTIVVAGRRQAAKGGSHAWYLQDGRHLNTDDESTFEDLDDNVFTRIAD